MKFFGIIRELLTTVRFTTQQQLGQPNIDLYGNIGVSTLFSGADGVPLVWPFVTDGGSQAAGAIVPLVITETHLFDGTVWRRAVSATEDGSVPAGSLGVSQNISQEYVFNPASGVWERLPVQANTDVINPSILPLAASYLYAFNGASNDRLRSSANNADGVAVSTLGNLNALTFNNLFNGTTFDRERGNTNITVLASAARVASINSADIVNYNAKGLHLVIDVTAIAATPSITVTIQGKDELSGKYYTILTSAAIVAVGTTVLRVYPALVAAANLIANDAMPRTWRVSVVNADADSITYSVGASLIL